MAKSFEEIKDECSIIVNEVEDQKNTGKRVGDTIYDVLDYANSKADKNLSNVPDNTISPDKTTFSDLIKNFKVASSVGFERGGASAYLLHDSGGNDVYGLSTVSEVGGAKLVSLMTLGQFASIAIIPDGTIEERFCVFDDFSNVETLELETNKTVTGKGNTISFGLTKYNVVGSGNTVTAENAVVQGNNNTVNHANCIVIGNNINTVVSSGLYSVAGGLKSVKTSVSSDIYMEDDHQPILRFNIDPYQVIIEGYVHGNGETAWFRVVIDNNPVICYSTIPGNTLLNFYFDPDYGLVASGVNGTSYSYDINIEIIY